MLAALKKGDKVVTEGGMIGEVTEIDEDEIRIRIADKVEARFVRSAISRVIKN
jgi:preprotein translocase subunit YajC